MTPLSLFPSLRIKFSTTERSINDSLGFSFGRFISKTKSHLRGVFGFKNYFKISKLIFKNANCSRGFGGFFKNGGLLTLVVGFPDIRIWFRNARQIPPRCATACNTQEKTAGGRWGILNKGQIWGKFEANFGATPALGVIPRPHRPPAH